MVDGEDIVTDALAIMTDKRFWDGFIERQRDRGKPLKEPRRGVKY